MVSVAWSQSFIFRIGPRDFTACRIHANSSRLSTTGYLATPPPSNSFQNDSGHLAGGVIAGIAISIIFLVLGAGFVLCCFCVRRKKFAAVASHDGDSTGSGRASNVAGATGGRARMGDIELQNVGGTGRAARDADDTFHDAPPRYEEAPAYQPATTVGKQQPAT